MNLIFNSYMLNSLILLIIPQILYNAVVRPIVEQDPLQYDFFALLTIFRSTA